MKIHEFTKELLNELRNQTGCGIHHNGCPCNKCFHTWAEDDLGLNPPLAHLFWIVVLALRGDYTQEEILKGNVCNFKEIIKDYKK